MNKYYVFVPIDEANEIPEILNRSKHTEYSQCTVVGADADIYVVSFEAESPERAPAVYQNYKIMTPEQALLAMDNPEKRRRPAVKVYSTLQDDLEVGYDGRGQKFTCAIGAGFCNVDVLLEYHASLEGGYFFADSNAVVGDSVKAQIVDTENVLGLRDIDAFGYGVGVVAQILHWYVVPGWPIKVKVNDAMRLPAPNMTVRMLFETTSALEVKGLVNILSYRIQ